MSEVYVHEPATKGKVRLHTSHGDLDVELWSQECPKAARNFVQLCLEGYYDNTIFHRIIQDFIIQGGDPSGTGDGGESVYGEPFPDEFHSRLKYRYRGLVGVANRGPGTKTNGSQFFVTLARTDPLNNRHTLFGKVTGHTVYNLMAIAGVECDKNDRPFDPPVLKSTEVLWNPFDDIVPRDFCKKTAHLEPEEAEEDKPAKRETLKELKKGLLSFADDDDEEVDDSSTATQDERPAKKSKVMRSAHDLLTNDARLVRDSENSETEETEEERKKGIKRLLDGPSDDDSEGPTRGRFGRDDDDDEDEDDDDRDDQSRGDSDNLGSDHDSRGSDEKGGGSQIPVVASSVEQALTEKKRAREQEEAALRKDILKLKRKEEGGRARDADRIEFADLLSEKEKNREVMLLKRRNKHNRQLQAAVLDQLSGFTSRLRQQREAAKQEEASAESRNEGKEDEKLGIKLSEFSAVPNLDEEVDEADGAWMRSGGLKFASDASKAFKYDEGKSDLAVHDPLLVGDAKFDSDAMEALRRRRNERMKPSLKGDHVDWRH